MDSIEVTWNDITATLTAPRASARSIRRRYYSVLENAGETFDSAWETASLWLYITEINGMDWQPPSAANDSEILQRWREWCELPLSLVDALFAARFKLDTQNSGDLAFGEDSDPNAESGG